MTFSSVPTSLPKWLRLKLAKKGKHRKKKAIYGDPLMKVLVSRHFTPEQLADFHLWVLENSHSRKQPNMSAGEFASHVFEALNVELSNANARQLLRELGFQWTVLKSGYYEKQQLKAWVVYHRYQVVSLIEYLHVCAGITVWYQDECPFRKNMYQKMAWVAEGNVEHVAQNS